MSEFSQGLFLGLLLGLVTGLVTGLPLGVLWTSKEKEKFNG
jgi:hypothetical protein